MNRRKFLKIAGSTSVIVAAGSSMGMVAGCSPTAALKPWENAGSVYSDPMRQALSYAILAPNPHNRQPWIVHLKSDTEAVLTCDLDRLLPATDPFSRQIVIGLGCFLETFTIAATEQGFHANIEYFPEGAPERDLDRRAIARLTLEKQAELATDPLFGQILHRRTNRAPYDINRPVQDAILQRMRNATPQNVRVGTTNQGEKLARLRSLTQEAMETEIRTPEAYQESIDLMRIGRDEIVANPDGISLGGAFLEGLKLAGILTRKNLADPTSSAFQTGLDMMDEASRSSMGFVWIITPVNNRLAQITAGRAYMRVALQATADGLVMQPMSQSLQEYPAMAPYYQTIHKKLATEPGETVQMLARLGYADDQGPAPRWPLQSRLKES